MGFLGFLEIWNFGDSGNFWSWECSGRSRGRALTWAGLGSPVPSHLSQSHLSPVPCPRPSPLHPVPAVSLQEFQDFSQGGSTLIPILIPWLRNSWKRTGLSWDPLAQEFLEKGSSRDVLGSSSPGIPRKFLFKTSGIPTDKGEIPSGIPIFPLLFQLSSGPIPLEKEFPVKSLGIFCLWKSSRIPRNSHLGISPFPAGKAAGIGNNLEKIPSLMRN